MSAGFFSFDPAFGLVLDEDAFDEFFDEVLFLGVEASHRLKLKLEVVVRPSFMLIKKQLIGTDAQGYCEFTKDLE